MFFVWRESKLRKTGQTQIGERSPIHFPQTGGNQHPKYKTKPKRSKRVIVYRSKHMTIKENDQSHSNRDRPPFTEPKKSPKT